MSRVRGRVLACSALWVAVSAGGVFGQSVGSGGRVDEGFGGNGERLDPEGEGSSEASAGAAMALGLGGGRGGAGWVVRAQPRLWFPALQGEFGAEPGEAFDLDAISATEVRASPALALTFRRERWTVHAEGFWFGYDERSEAEEGLTVGGVGVAAGERVGFDVRYGAASVGLGRRVWDLDAAYAGRPGEPTPFNVPSGGTHAWVDAYLGARMFFLDVEVEDDGGVLLADASEVWVDPVVGARLSIDLPRGFGVEVRSDVGGFGVGSEFAWDIVAAFEWEVASGIAAEVGFRHLSTRREIDGGIEWDASIAGLFGGVTVRY